MHESKRVGREADIKEMRLLSDESKKYFSGLLVTVLEIVDEEVFDFRISLLAWLE